MDSVLNFKWREPFVWLVPIPNRYAGELEKYHVTMTRCKEPIALWYYFAVWKKPIHSDDKLERKALFVFYISNISIFRLQSCTQPYQSFDGFTISIQSLLGQKNQHNFGMSLHVKVHVSQALHL